MLVVQHNDLNILHTKVRSIKLLWIGHAFELVGYIFKDDMRDRFDMVDMGHESILRINKDKFTIIDHITLSRMVP